VQQIVGGSVRFEVLFARMSAIRVMGEPGPDARLLERYLQPLANSQPFNRLTAERNLLLARTLPGYQIRLSLRPTGNRPGDMVGEVRVEHVPVMADISIQNLAAPDTGRFGAQARVQFNGLFHRGDRTVLSAYSTAQIDEQQVYQFGHDLTLGSKGLRIGGRLTYALTRPNIPGAQVEGRTLYASVEANYPLRLSQAASLTGSAGLEIVQQTIRFGGAPFARDRLRIAYLRLDGEAMDLKGAGPGGTIGWRARGSLQLRQGLNIFGASPDCRGVNPVCLTPGFIPLSVANADPSPTLVRAQAEFEIRPLRNATVLLAPRAQYSARTLPAFEQFSAGNYSVGRGFDPGTLSGDSGLGYQMELRLDPRRLTRRLNLSFQPYVFADQAWVWRNGIPGSQMLQSAGGGVRFFLPGRMRLDLTGAAPVSRFPGETGHRPARFLMTLTANILPWRNR
jgi:hemolysin activation/secretion protein